MAPSLEVEAAVDFQVQFMDEYGDDHNINFNNSTLAEAIAETCHVPIESRKILGLYFHNANDTFAKEFCSTIQNAETKQILERSFYFLGWNVNEILYQESLLSSLRECLGSTLLLESLITTRCSAFVIIFAIENQACIFSLLHGNDCNILATLKESENSFNIENNNERQLQTLIESRISDSNGGSVQFQQMMNDLLGSRDYDKFESDEHELLKSKIGFAKFGPPTNETGYDDKQKIIINTTYDKICMVNNEYCEFEDQILISFIYNCLEPLPHEKLLRAKKYSDYNPLNDLLPVPIFVIRKCVNGSESCRSFIDNDDRVYDSWENYIENNKHYECNMVLPKNGKYMEEENGNVILEKHLSPACGIKTKLLNATDVSTSVLGIASGTVFGAALIPAIPVAPVVLSAAAVAGVGVGIYSIIRSAFNIYDRKLHQESMSFSNSEARGAYLNIMAGALGFAGAGATTALSQFAMRGVNITKGVQYTVNGINICNIAASGISVGNSTYQVVNDWITEDQVPSTLTIIQLTSSILFFANATFNFKTAGTITEEAQMNALNKYQDSLRSNRHRKTFNKILKETIRQNNGDRNTAHAEIISACRKIPDKDTVFAVLTRNNKLFNKDGIRIFADQGQIKLNGVTVDLIEFGDMSNTKRSLFLSDMPLTPEPLQSINSLDSTSSFSIPTADHLILIQRFGTLIVNQTSLSRIIYELLHEFSYVLQGKIIKILRAVLDIVLKEFPSIGSVIQKYSRLRVTEPVELVLKLILERLSNYADNLEQTYREELHAAQQLPNYNEAEFNRSRQIDPNTLRKYLFWFEKAVGMFITSSEGIDERLLRELVNYTFTFVTNMLYNYSISSTPERSNTSTRLTTSCDKCNGHYFSSVTANSFL